MKKYKKTGMLLVLLFCLCFMLGKGIQAAEDKKIKVLVPLMNDSGFVTYENGTFKGYYIDYLTEIAKYTGWDYEFTAIENYEDLNKACESGQFDLMTGIVYSEEYDKMYFDYPKHAIGAKRYVFAVPKDSGLTADKEYSYLRGVKIGIASNSGITELEERFRNFCFMYGINCVSDKKDYPKGVNFIHIDPSSWREKINSGEIDGILASDAFCLSQNMYAITTFGLDQSYFVTPNGNTRILRQLDDSIEKISNFDTEYNDRLYDKYFSRNSKHEISFSKKEKTYLSQGHVWKVSLPKDYAPYSYINAHGKPAGLITEVLNQITSQTKGSIKFLYLFYDSMKEASEAVKKGKCDINGISVYSLLEKRDSRERRSMSYYTDNFYYYKNSAKASDANEQVIMLPELPKLLFKDIDKDGGSVTEGSPEKCLEQAENGFCSFTIMLSHVGDYYKSYNGYNSLSSYPTAKGEVMFCLAYSPDMEQFGINIIDKFLNGIDEEELDNYVTQISLFDHREQTIGDYIKEHVEIFTLMLAGILFIICTLLIIIVINVTSNSRKINDLLYKDDITEGISYRKFLELAKQEVQKSGNKLMLYINISSFKYINDVFGYEQGNIVLREVMDYLKACSQNAVIARIYADRFVLLCSYRDKNKAVSKIERSLQGFEELCHEKFPSFNIWVKVGAYPVKKEDDIQKAVNFANYAVDEIQKLSKNDYIFYDEMMHDKVLTQKEIEKDMRGAMENGEFEPFYQPKYNIETKQLIGAEALVRWRHPEKGLLSPGLFIPIFEKNHYIIQVDFCIFECVCRFIRKLMEEGAACFPISSNFSRLHLNQPDFVEHLIQIVNQYQVPSKYLEIEITETVAVEDFEQLIVTVQQLKQNGFQVSIDDFGSGYSSVQLLYKLPIDVLKFDKAFVDNENVSQLETELVDSIIYVSHKNGIRIICEGVETPEQEEFVRRHNCIYVQGFLYSKPVPEAEFEELLTQNEN